MYRVSFFLVLFFFLMQSTFADGGSDSKVDDSAEISSEKPLGKTRDGNLIGTTTVTVNIGVLKITKVFISCDDDQTVTCVLEQGKPKEEDPSNGTITLPDGSGFGGLWTGFTQISGTGGTTYEYEFEESSFYTF